MMIVVRLYLAVAVAVASMLPGAAVYVSALPSVQPLWTSTVATGSQPPPTGAVRMDPTDWRRAVVMNERSMVGLDLLAGEQVYGPVATHGAYLQSTVCGESGGRGYLATVNQTGTQAIVVLDMKTGDVAWTVAADFAFDLCVDASTSRLFALEAPETVHAYDLATGGNPTSFKVAHVPTLLGAAEGMVLLLEQGGALVGASASSGAQAWSTKIAITTASSASTTYHADTGVWYITGSGPAFRGGVAAVVGVQRASGKVLFSTPVQGQAIYPPVDANGRVVFTAVPTSRDRYGYSVFAVDATSRAVDWVLNTSLAMATLPAVDSSNVYLTYGPETPGTSEYGVMAVDQATGVVEWKYGFGLASPNAESDQVCSPVMGDGMVIASLYIGQGDRAGQHVVALPNATQAAA